MSQSWNLDPTKGDYVMDGGAPEQTDSLTVPAYFRLKTKNGKWLYAPDNKYGSKFYTVLKRPVNNSNLTLENIAAQALQPMADDGRASQIQVDVVENQRNGTALQISITDASGEVETATFSGIGLGGGF